MDWVPAYLDLWLDDKEDLSHATRSIFLRLCHAARRAARGGLVPFPPSAPTDEAAILAIVRGKLTEVRVAISEMLEHRMVEFEVEDDQRCLRILSWTPAWVLDLETDDAADAASSEAPQRARGGRPRKWSSEADRSRARRAAGKNGRPEMRPEMNNRSTGNSETGRPENEYPVGGGGKGGATPPDQKKVEEITGEVEERKPETAGAREAAAGQSVGGRRGSRRAATLGLPGMDTPAAGRGKGSGAPPSPVTEVRDAWRATWADAGMPGPAPWGVDAATCAKAYLETPGASLETARQAFLGMLRTPAGDWHRTHEGGRHATASAALAGKHVVAFTAAGKQWLAAQEAAARPKREPPPPDPIPQMFVDMAEQDERRGARIPLPTPQPPEVP